MPIDHTLVTSDRASQEFPQVRTPVNNTPHKPCSGHWGASSCASPQRVGFGEKHLSLSENTPIKVVSKSPHDAQKVSTEVAIDSRMAAMCKLASHGLNQVERHNRQQYEFLTSLSSDNQKFFGILKQMLDMLDFISRSTISSNEALPAIQDSLDRLVDEMASMKGRLAQFEEGVCKNV